LKYAPFMLICAIAVLIFTGLVVDEGGQIGARQVALTIAQGAARAGTNAAGGDAVNGDAFDLSGETAIEAANQYIAAAGNGTTGSATIVGGKIIVTVHTVYKTQLSFLVGIDKLPATGIAAAQLIDG